MRCTTRDGVDVEILCFRFGNFVGFSLWLQGITLKTHDVTSLIRSQRLLSFFQVSCPISCSLFLYHRNFSYPHKHNVIQTAEVTTALGWPWDEHEHPPTLLSMSGSPHCPFPTAQQAQSSTFRKNGFSSCSRTGSLILTVFIAVPQCCLTREGWALLLPHSSRDTGGGCWLQHRVQGCTGNSCCTHGTEPHSPAPPALVTLPSMLLQPQPAPSASQPLLPLSQPQLLSCSGS